MNKFKLTCKGYTYEEGRESKALEFKDKIKELREQGLTYTGIASVIRLDDGVRLTERLVNQFVTEFAA